MSIKTESNRLFNVYFGENKDVSVTNIEAKNATEAIERAKKTFNTSFECTSVESKAIYKGAVELECGASDLDEDAVFEIVVRGTNAEKVEKLKKAIALAIGGIAVEFSDISSNDEHNDGRFLQKVINENDMSVVGL